MADLSVMYQPLAGGWVKLGTQTGGGRGVFPGSITLEGDRGEGGCISASFKLKQDPRWINTEMQAFTPIAFWDGAECVWSGRTIMTPTTFGESDVEIVVQCQGWWQHLKDDCMDKEWVVADLSRMVDQRQASDAALGSAQFYASAQVQSGDGIITLMNPNGSVLTTSGRAGVSMDLGENNRAERVVVTYQSSNNVATVNLTVGTGTTGCVLGSTHVGGGGGANIANNAGASGTAVVTPSTVANARFVSVGMHVTTGHTAAADEWFKITGIIVFMSTTYESGNASVLKASTVISETLDELCPKISSDRSRISTTSLSLPQFPGGRSWRYADELVRQANAPHGYVMRLSPDPLPVFEYHPVPTDYRFVVGEGEYTLLEPSAQDGQGVANRVITEYDNAAGDRRFATAVPSRFLLSQTQLPNPSAASSLTGWTTFGSAARDTVTFNTSPASFRISSATSGGMGTSFGSELSVVPGRVYAVSMSIRLTGTMSGVVLQVRDSAQALLSTVDLTSFANASAVGAWAVTPPLLFKAPQDGLANINMSSDGANATYADDITIFISGSSIVDRRGFRRTFLRPMGQRSDATTSQAIADIELSAAEFPPFKGTISVVGRVPLKGGGHIDASHIPGMTGENILIKNLHNPNTQALGRIGNIQSASYDEKTQRVTIGIDRDLYFISQLRDRLALFSR